MKIGLISFFAARIGKAHKFDACECGIAIINRQLDFIAKIGQKGFCLRDSAIR